MTFEAAGSMIDGMPVVDGFGLARADALLADHLNAAVSRFGPHAMGVIDLPPLEVANAVAAPQIKVAATVLWLSEIEESGLLELVEALAEGVIHGTLLLPLMQSGGRALMHYWRDRHERFGAEERRALYARLFDEEATRRIDALAVTLSEIGRAGPMESANALNARANAIAAELAALLSERSVGITAFAARSIVAQIKRALALLKDPEIARALGGQGVWQLVRTMAPVLLHRQVDPGVHLALARSGLAIVEWLAQQSAVDRNSGVVRAAEEWRTVKGLP